MKYKTLLFYLLCINIISLNIYAQPTGHTQWGSPTKQPRFPKGNYIELPDPQKSDSSEWAAIKTNNICWGSTNVRYPKAKVPVEVSKSKTLRLKAWKGECVNAQFMVFGTNGMELSCRPNVLKSKCDTISPSYIKPSFVRYVMTDELNKDGMGACGHRPDISKFDSSLVADVLDHLTKKLHYNKYTVQPIWLSIQIPNNCISGLYKTKIEVFDNESNIGHLYLEIEVGRRILPHQSAWKFHLDLWQNPFAEARYFGTDLWSDAHLEAMRPSMELLASAGQKVITASIMHKPWGGQTEDYFESMVTWMKKADGSWRFDFDVFDRWVEFMISCGINKQINCYSMIPWSRSFRYFDQASDNFRMIEADPGNDEYCAVWTDMLKQFAAHLKEKGWFERTTIAMDERPKEFMQAAFGIIRAADPEFKVSLAGDWHHELEENLYDYCIAFKNSFPDSVLKKRHAKHQISTYYTCCTEPRPNTFTFSPPAEAEFIPLYAIANNLDGYLRWAYNSYTLEPLLDSRFRSFAAGDCYIVYPQGRSSIRMQHLIDGIESYEKIRILREEFALKKDKQALKDIDKIIEQITFENLKKQSATNLIEKINLKLNKWI